MTRSIALLILPAMALILGITACGGTAEPAAKPAYNPLAAEQQLIRDAEALQGILDKDAERKKQAVQDAN